MRIVVDNYGFLMNSVAHNLGASGTRGVSFDEFKAGGLHEKRTLDSSQNLFEDSGNPVSRGLIYVSVLFLLLSIADLTDRTLDTTKLNLCSDH